MQTATPSSGFVAEAGLFSKFIDMFDIYLPTMALSSILFYFPLARLARST